MKIRDAKVSDALAIQVLINSHAEVDRMLFRSMADIYENIQTFHVAEVGGRIVGCCALQPVWGDLAEVKSLAVAEGSFGRGIGRGLVAAAAERAAQLGIKKLFALTLETGFFEKVGFKRVDTELLPMKVWSDCSKCPKQDHCDEVAFLMEL